MDGEGCCTGIREYLRNTFRCRVIHFIYYRQDSDCVCCALAPSLCVWSDHIAINTDFSF